MTGVKITHSTAAMQLLKANLGYFSSEIPQDLEIHLGNLLDYAYQRLAQTADIHLEPGELVDDQLQAMYAAWLYRHSSDGADKSPMLKETIKDYQLNKALAADEEADV